MPFKMDRFSSVDPSLSFMKMTHGWQTEGGRASLTFVQKNSCQSYVVTSILSSSDIHFSWLIHDHDQVRPLLLYFLKSPKHQSGLNFVWPGIMNESVISVCCPVIVLHKRYCTMVAFLFCPPQLSACRCTLSSPSPWCTKKWWSMLMMAFEPVTMSTASSMRYVICRGMASQHTPKIAHFVGVRKYSGPGVVWPCRGQRWVLS